MLKLFLTIISIILWVLFWIKSMSDEQNHEAGVAKLGIAFLGIIFIILISINT